MLLQQFLGLEEHHYFFKDRWIRWALFVLVVAQVLVWLVTAWVMVGLPPFVALKSTVYFGINLFGERELIWRLPLLGLLFGIVNVVVASRVYSKYRWLAQQVLVYTILWQGLLILALWRISLLNRT